MRKEKKAGMPHNFLLSMSVSWTIKSKEHAGCYSKLKKKEFPYILFPKNIGFWAQFTEDKFEYNF